MTKKSSILDSLLFYFKEQNEQEEEETPIQKEAQPQEQYQEAPPEGEAPPEEVISPEEQLSTVDQVYRLKKLYAKLIAISRIMDHYSAKSFEDLQKKILESIDLFHIVVSNYDVFKGKINTIIKSFEQLLQQSVEEIEKLTKTEDI